MVDRCTNPRSADYPRYGGRGIKLHPAWRDFKAFIADMGPRPSMQHSLDRYPNKDGNYELGNVRWATLSEQARNQHRNQHRNHILTVNGVSDCLAGWAERTGLSKEVIRQRLLRGWSMTRAVTTPLVRR